MKKYKCNECGHKVGTIGGIRGHVWAKHRNRGKDKKPIRRDVDWSEVDSTRVRTGLALLPPEILAGIVTGDFELDETQRDALHELSQR